MKDLNRLLNIRYPIVQAPMLGITTPSMVAAIANAGGLGSLPIGGLSPDASLALIKETKSKTDKPFAVNVFAHSINIDFSEKDIQNMEQYLEEIHSHHGLKYARIPLSTYKFYNHLDQIDLLLSEKVPIVSFTLGIPEARVVERFREQGVKTIGTATSVKEAKLLDEAGLDAIVAQGIEAGGHRGSFLEGEHLPQVGLISLVPQIVDVVSIPVIAAGGLFDKRTIKAGFALGAQGVQMGTYFIAANESMASEVYIDSLRSSVDTSTELTQAFTGKWARGIRNDFMEKMKVSGLTIPYFIYQNRLTTALRNYGKSSGISEIMSLWAGQAASKTRRGSTKDLFLDLIEQIQNDRDPIF
jgi:nitronate monooxygenase